MKRNIIKILMISIAFLLIFYTKSYCVESGTVRMQVIDGATAWTNVTVSQSYEECESLNSATSTLGTTALKAHLTTDADWNAMAIFSVSQYGGQTSNTPTWTNNNNSGIYKIGEYNWYSTGLLNTVTNSNSNFTSLFDSSGNPKKYVKQWSKNRTENDFVGFNDNGTYGWLGAEKRFNSATNYPASIKEGLFGELFAFSNDGRGFDSSGACQSKISFRPVIWN